jgi:hypothetical protein
MENQKLKTDQMNNYFVDKARLPEGEEDELLKELDNLESDQAVLELDSRKVSPNKEKVKV